MALSEWESALLLTERLTENRDHFNGLIIILVTDSLRDTGSSELHGSEEAWDLTWLQHLVIDLIRSLILVLA